MPSPVAVIIPARFASSRFPGKMLAAETGKPLIQHTWERAKLSTRASRVLIAADDERIIAAAKRFGAEAVMTRVDHPNGSSRLAEAAAKLTESIIINVQGDEPELEPELIDAAVEALDRDSGAVVSTIASPFNVADDPTNPNIVKVVLSAQGRALYFSRSLIPFDRDNAGVVKPLRHVGLYGYRREFLLKYPSLPATPLEKSESLEQLRILEHGHAIAVAVRDSRGVGIDTPEQYAAFVARVMSGAG
jgi:3-deoxy-manno-octulosonate cytidylyltransferase (CMP-KDO synthetase)